MAKAPETAPEAEQAPVPAAAVAPEPAPETAPETAPEADVPEGFVRATITKAGDGLVHTGQGIGETFPRGASIVVPAETAASLEAKHYVETD